MKQFLDGMAIGWLIAAVFTLLGGSLWLLRLGCWENLFDAMCALALVIIGCVAPAWAIYRICTLRD